MSEQNTDAEVSTSDAAIERAMQEITSALSERELEFTVAEGKNVVVTLPGERKLKTTCLLSVGQHGVRVEAFVCRKPDENFEGVYRYLLRRNRRLYGVHYTVDRVGDIYLVGRISISAVTSDELDRVLGQTLEAADGDFNTLLELGFSSSIKREWAWRTSRGEPLANLKAFEHLIDAPGASGATGDVPGASGATGDVPGTQ